MAGFRGEAACVRIPVRRWFGEVGKMMRWPDFVGKGGTGGGI